MRKFVIASSFSWFHDLQFRLLAGILISIGVVLAITISWVLLGLSGLVGIGLIFGCLSDPKVMASILANLQTSRHLTTFVSKEKIQ